MDLLVVSDLDGTLLRSDRTLTARSIRVLNRAIDQGMGITIATARSWFTAKPLVEALRLVMPVIVYNGAVVLRPSDGIRLVENFLDPVVSAELVAAGQRRRLPPFVSGFGGEGEETFVHSAPVNRGQRRLLGQRTSVNDPRLRYDPKVKPPQRVVSVQFIAPRQDLEDLVAWVGETFGDQVATALSHDVYLPGNWQFQVYHPRANKGDMVRWVADGHGVPLEHVMVVGDGRNDLPMFAVAGRRLAVANADPDVLAAADEVLPANDSDGVASLVERLLQGPATA